MPRRRSNIRVSEPPLYRLFLEFIFNEDEHQDPEYWEEGPGVFYRLCKNAPAEIIPLFLHLMRNLRGDLASYSLEKIAGSVNSLFHPGFSETLFVLMNEDVPEADRCEAIRAMTHLYEDLFEIRCAPVMLHRNQPGGNALNDVCYMLWDVTSLNYFGRDIRKRDSLERAAARPMAEAVFSVLEFSLYSENVACVESGLHGLGHMASDWPDEVKAIIDLYLRRRPNHDPRILRYADLAREGRVQ